MSAAEARFRIDLPTATTVFWRCLPQSTWADTVQPGNSA